MSLLTTHFKLLIKYIQWNVFLKIKMVIIEKSNNFIKLYKGYSK